MVFLDFLLLQLCITCFLGFLTTETKRKLVFYLISII